MLMSQLLLTMRLFVGLILFPLFAYLSASSQKFRSDVYPRSISKFEIRLDPYTKKPVVSGLLPSLPSKSSLVDFRRHLQCATTEPNLNFNNAIISRMRLAPFDSKQIKAISAYVEDYCGGNWHMCNDHIGQYERGDYHKRESFNGLNGWSLAELIRVINGTLYVDWPWGMERFESQCQNPIAPLMNMTLSRISDMRDSAFFTGGADPAIHEFNSQIPYFSECTHEDFADIIFPWINMWMTATQDYNRMIEENIPFTEEGYQRFEQEYRPWSERVPKAAMFGAHMYHRQFLMDVARQRPDLMESSSEYHECIHPWNPASEEECDGKRWDGKWPDPEEFDELNKLPLGYGGGYYNVTHRGFRKYYPGSYKYVVVPLGAQEVLSTSARIAHIMFYSGAVVFLQRSSWKFHVEAQLRPWVHYVPISFSGADLAEKVEWLKEHDDLAQRIAENGRNFARSYFRLEDFFCYTAHTLDAMAELSLLSDGAKKVFNPKIVPRKCGNEESWTLWYEWPKKTA